MTRDVHLATSRPKISRRRAAVRPRRSSVTPDRPHSTGQRRNLYCSFRPANSLGRAEIAGLDLLDLSLHDTPSWQQPQQPQQQQEGTRNFMFDGCVQCQNTHRCRVASRNTVFSKNPNRITTSQREQGRKKSSFCRERQESLTTFMLRRVETFANNVETIGLLITGRRELDLSITSTSGARERSI